MFTDVLSTSYGDFHVHDVFLWLDLDNVEKNIEILQESRWILISSANVSDKQ